MKIAAFAALVLFACPPVPPVVPPPDASDASALGEASPAPPGVDPVCMSACSAMVLVGCVQLPTCASVLTNVENTHLKVDPSNKTSQNWLTCGALAGVKTVSDVQAHGWDCGP